MAAVQETAQDTVRDYVRSVRGEQPQRHNHYTPEAFFDVRRDEGAVYNRYGQRMLRMPEEFIIGVCKGLEEEVGEKSAGEIMYACGESWGGFDMESFEPRIAEEFECEFSKLGMGMMLETWWWPLTIEGWGTWRYDFTHGKQGLLFVDLFESAVARSLGNVGAVVCHFYAGLFAKVFGRLARRKLSCIEIQCYSMGEDYCKFLIASDERVNAAEFWRNEGASARDILKKILD